MTIYYSATTNAFYDSQVYNVNNIPEDKVAVSASTYSNLMAQQCAGRVIVAAADGTPTTIVQTCDSCTSTKYATKTELTNGLAGKANDNAVVHKTGDETINGVKSFNEIIKATNGTVQVGADTGYSVTFNYNGNITSKQARGTYSIFLPEGSGTLALTSDLDSKANDNAVVHKSGNETINGVKSFGSMIKATNGTVQVGADTGYSVTFNYNGNITSKQARGTYNIFLPDANGTLALTSDLDSKANDSNVVHRSGNETIDGIKTFTNQLYLGAGGGSYGLISAKDTNSILRLFGGTSPSTGANLDLYGENQSSGGFSLRARTSDKIVGLDGKVDGTLKWNGKDVALDENLVHRSGDESINGIKTFSNKIKGNLQGNADTATSADNGVDSCGEGWIRFKNGIQMCWGSGNNSNTATSIVVNFARTFVSPPVISAQCYNPAHYICWVSTKYSNYFTLNFGIASTVAYEWFAIGTWK